VVEFRLLGPVEVVAAGQALDAGQPRQRAVLAALLVDAGRVVPAHVLVDRVWGDAPPPTARGTLRAHAARIRRLLERADAGAGQPPPLVHRSGGYVLDVDHDRVDLHRFRRLLARGREQHRPDGQRVLLLREAAGLWRGEPLAGLAGEWAGTTRRGWRQEHLEAMVAWAQAELRVGNATAPVGPLTELAREHPLTESVTAALMRALAAAGRPSEALDCYTALRRRLVEELGTDPGAELQALQQGILRGDLDLPHPGGPAEPVPPVAVPAQLPADVAAFTGRRAELAELDAVLAGTDPPAAAAGGPPPAAVVISVVSGTAGVGKTALAVYWAHRVRSRFDDGQLYVNLRGYDAEQPMSAGDVLARFLAALGVPGNDIPLDLDERAARYRTEIAGRRMLVVLDNAASVEQVRPLLPGTGPVVVLVTSRDSLAGLVALHGARRLDLDLLPAADATALLRRLVGGRVDGDPAAAARLVTLCARLPLALRVVAELAAARPTSPLAEFAAELADRRSRVQLLDAGGDPRAAVAVVFSWSIQQLPPAAARMFGLLGLHPGPDTDAYAAAALAGTSLDQARRSLSLLTRAHLLHSAGGGRYDMHDLLRAYAAGLVTATDPPGDPRAAVGRLLDHYLGTAAAAMDQLWPAEAHRRPSVPPAGTPGPTLGHPDAARAWLDAERGCLAAAVDHAATHGWAGHAVRLSGVLFRYLDDDGYPADALAIHTHACRAAGQAADRAGEAQAHTSLGALHHRLGRYGQAVEHLEQALALFRQVDDQPGQARALNNLGGVEERRGRYLPAICRSESALALYREVGDRVGEARTLTNLGLVEARLGRYRSAAGRYNEALALFRQAGDQVGEAHALNKLGDVEARLDRWTLAADRQQAALALFRQLGSQDGEAWALESLGALHTRLSRPELAVSHFEQALALFLAAGDRDGEPLARNGLGEAACAAGRPADALPHHAAALAVATGTGAGYQQARAHAGLGHAHRALADPAGAREHYTCALVIYTNLGTPDADEVRGYLRGLGQPAVSGATSP
jgi:DNA-binding SARP family transcriptional activator